MRWALRQESFALWEDGHSGTTEPVETIPGAPSAPVIGQSMSEKYILLPSTISIESVRQRESREPSNVTASQVRALDSKGQER